MSIWTKTEGGWAPVEGGWSQQTPPAPVIHNQNGGAVVYFATGGSGSAGPTLVYGATVSPSSNGETVVVDQVNLEVAVEGTVPFTDYVVSVYGVNIAGNGEAAYTDPFQLNYNEATGGTETVVDDYNGTGEQWMVHTFDASGTFVPVQANTPFNVLVVAGGGGGNWIAGGAGGYGGQVYYLQRTLTATAYEVVRGNGGGGGHGDAINGTASVFDGLIAAGGQGMGTGGGWTAQEQVTSNISGASQKFSGQPPYDSGSVAGMGGMSQANFGGGGQSGKVIVAYQIGVSTTTQIRLAQEQRSALADGREVGYGEGFTDGRSAASTEVLEAIEAIRLAEEKQ